MRPRRSASRDELPQQRWCGWWGRPPAWPAGLAAADFATRAAGSAMSPRPWLCRGE
eukprot:CAMPEP_0185383288 /NCGR_PEP_ID=MMETSP1364-20130426/57215_1 /TAXON_ID=38817 /ORGANISM="Gephyrocapsa oceanica, Strain RCC1303" /LENGTH=55 /DNA_ID=CAMNT_0027985017 /DNA_START=273 /DNA_END=437 /DNA_ORIENTATION=-